MINGSQCAAAWHVDDIKLSNIQSNVIDDLINTLNLEYGKESPLTIKHGKVHEYLGMMIDFSTPGQVQFSMKLYIDNLISEYPDDIVTGALSTLAGSHLFCVNPSATKLATPQTKTFHHLTAKLLYLCKCTHPDLQTSAAFLTTRVQSPDIDDWKKLGCCLHYLWELHMLPLTLSCDQSPTIRWWIDASFATHPNMCSHTWMTMSLGCGAMYSFSTKQCINTHSSTEAEVVGVNYAMGLWTWNFLEAQGIPIVDNIIFQDNESAMLLAKNGHLSSTKNTHHINICYFFITDYIKQQCINLAHCPTTDMLADFLTKPLQGSLFRKFHQCLLNLPPLSDPLAGQESVGTKSTVTTTLPEHAQLHRHLSVMTLLECAQPHRSAPTVILGLLQSSQNDSSSHTARVMLLSTGTHTHNMDKTMTHPKMGALPLSKYRFHPLGSTSLLRSHPRKFIGLINK